MRYNDPSGHWPPPCLFCGNGSAWEGVIQLVLNGLNGKEHTDITGKLLEEIESDPASQEKQKLVILQLKQDPRFGKEDFTSDNFAVDQKERRIALGGGLGSWAKPADVIDKLLAYFRPPTIAMRNAHWNYSASVSADKNIHLTMTITDKLDLRDEGHRNFLYKGAVRFFGFFYHDVFGGSDKMTTSATWVINK